MQEVHKYPLIFPIFVSIVDVQEGIVYYNRTVQMNFFQKFFIKRTVSIKRTVVKFLESSLLNVQYNL